MQKITLVAIGSLKAAWAKEACSDFIMRLPGYCDLVIQEVQPSKSKDPKKQVEDESERLSAAIEKIQVTTCLLDEFGKRKTSVEFSDFLLSAKDQGDHVAFILGGSYGVTDDLRKAVDCSLRLSDMTLPHELCRVLFLEQLYRGFQIGSGGKYHHQ